MAFAITMAVAGAHKMEQVGAMERIGDAKDKNRIISVGMLYFEKKQDITIKAMKELIKKYPELKLTIVGDGEERENLEKLVNDLGLSNFVEFTGHIKNDKVMELMSKSYIFIIRF